MNIHIFNSLVQEYGDTIVCVDMTGCYYFSINCPANNEEGLELIELYKDDPNVFVGTNFAQDKITSFQIKNLDEVDGSLCTFILEYVGMHGFND